MKSLITKIIAILALLIPSGKTCGAGTARGLVLYDEPPATYVLALEFVNLQNTSVEFTTATLSNGTKEEIRHSGVVAVIEYPPDVPTGSFANDAAAAAKNIQALRTKYPQCAVKLNKALTKWTNALAFFQQKQRSASAAPPATPTPGTTLEFGGVKYTEATLTSFDGAYVGIEHCAGFARIPAIKLKPEQIAALNGTSSSVRIDPSKIANPPTVMRAIEETDQSKPSKAPPIVAADDVDSRVAQAEVSIRTGDISQAVSAYEKALEINPVDSSLYVKLGMACLNYSRQNRGIGDSMDFLYKARDAFSKAIRLNSSNPDAYLGRGVVFDELVKPEQALADLTRAIELDPKKAEAYKRRADVFYRMDRNEQAISDYTKALAILPDYRDALSARERAQKEIGKVRGDQKAWAEGRAPEGFDAQVEASRHKAYHAYPDVRDGSTELARRVNLAVQGASQTNPELLHDPEWPFKITKAVAEQLNKEESDARGKRRAQINEAIRRIDIAIESQEHVMEVTQGLLVRKNNQAVDPRDEIQKLEAKKQELLRERGQ